MAQPNLAVASLWRILAVTLGKITIVPRRLPILGTQVPEEGTNDDYVLFCRVKLGDGFNNERYIAVRKLGYGQYSTV